MTVSLLFGILPRATTIKDVARLYCAWESQLYWVYVQIENNQIIIKSWTSSKRTFFPSLWRTMTNIEFILHHSRIFAWITENYDSLSVCLLINWDINWFDFSVENTKRWRASVENCLLLCLFHTIIIGSCMTWSAKTFVRKNRAGQSCGRKQEVILSMLSFRAFSTR